ncbi:ATPase with role in protein import into the ER, partial [Tulasnella sp. 417]
MTVAGVVQGCGAHDLRFAQYAVVYVHGGTSSAFDSLSIGDKHLKEVLVPQSTSAFQGPPPSVFSPSNPAFHPMDALGKHLDYVPSPVNPALHSIDTLAGVSYNIDRCNEPPYGGPPTPPKQIISIFGGTCSQVWLAVVDVTLKNEKKPFTLNDISAMIFGKMKQTAKTYLSERVTHAIVTVPASFNDAFTFVSWFTSAFRCPPGQRVRHHNPLPLAEPSPQAMHQDQLSDLKYAELQANAKKRGIRASGRKEHLAQQLA